MSSNPACPFGVWYLDDGTLGGTAEEVLNALDRVLTLCQAFCLELNERKCEVLSSDQNFINAIRNKLSTCAIVAPTSAELLGAPLSCEAATATLTKKMDCLNASVTRLTRIDRHDAFTLLRVSLGHPRLEYTLRAGPSFDSPALQLYDEALRECAEECLNVRLEKCRWTQATLPPGKGGLGLRTPHRWRLRRF